MTEQCTLLPDNPCPIGRAVDIVGDRWSLLILRHANIGVTRFDQFRAELGISDNILSNRLAKLVEAGVLVKVPYRDDRRTRHEYRLTSAGADLTPVFEDLARWGQAHTLSGERCRPAMKILHSTCGEELAEGHYCAHCGRTVERAEISWYRPWRSRTPFALAEPVD
ncbi:helix-turn-helix domain-containing protein [Pseudonocardia yunnanensis]|uniref:Winged helix-turn-helix transcriptional regulator n=1 Tax=Pseudonocardia yunnanensis TaxID=58107 RepID=A0ABW4F0Q7_9PSEU